MAHSYMLQFTKNVLMMCHEEIDDLMISDHLILSRLKIQYK